MNTLIYLGPERAERHVPLVFRELTKGLYFRQTDISSCFLGFHHCEHFPGIFTGTIINRENIGKTSEELVAKWNEENPTDQVVFSDN